MPKEHVSTPGLILKKMKLQARLNQVGATKGLQAALPLSHALDKLLLQLEARKAQDNHEHQLG
jgi:hypothetical protein